MNNIALAKLIIDILKIKGDLDEEVTRILSEVSETNMKLLDKLMESDEELQDLFVKKALFNLYATISISE